MSNMINVIGAGTGPGFVPALSTGALASLAGAGNCTLVFDLAAQDGGRSWMDVVSVMLGIANGVVSAGSNIKAYFSDDGTATAQVPAAPCYNNAGGGVNYTGGLDVFVLQLMVTKRYLRVVITNGATPQGATTALHAAYLNV